VLDVKLEAAVSQGTKLSAISPERFVAAVKGRKPAF
jgi:hypothetical protein